MYRSRVNKFTIFIDFHPIHFDLWLWNYIISLLSFSMIKHYYGSETVCNLLKNYLFLLNPNLIFKCTWEGACEFEVICFLNIAKFWSNHFSKLAFYNDYIPLAHELIIIGDNFITWRLPLSSLFFTELIPFPNTGLLVIIKVHQKW